MNELYFFSKLMRESSKELHTWAGVLGDQVYRLSQIVSEAGSWQEKQLNTLRKCHKSVVKLLNDVESLSVKLDYCAEIFENAEREVLDRVNSLQVGNHELPIDNKNTYFRILPQLISGRDLLLPGWLQEAVLKFSLKDYQE